MKVVIATQFPADTEAPGGGVEAVSVNLVAALAAFSDLDIHVVTIDPEVTVPNSDSWNGVVIHRLPRLEPRVLKNAIGPGRRQVCACIADLRPDVIHAHDTYGLMVKGFPAPRVFTIHGFIYADTRVSGKRGAWLRSLAWRRVETAGWADQPHIISISPYVREKLAGIATGTIHDIDNPISEPFFHVARAERAGVIFSAAVIGPRKNTIGLVDALDLLRAEGIRAELRLAGSASDAAYAMRLEARIRDLGLESQVTLLGRIGAERVRAELAGASVFALVSLEENSPMGIEEAMAAGVPVVTSNRCGMPYMVRHGESGYLVNPGNPRDVAKRLRRILEDESLRRAMGERSRAIALERFHPEVVARRTRDVYFEAAGIPCPDAALPSSFVSRGSGPEGSTVPG